jgi:tetratricopeptide (TPR) repeat protein
MTSPVGNDLPGYPETARQNAELAAMKRMLEVSEGCFSLSVAVCNSPALRDHLIRRLTESGPLEVVSVPKGIVDVYGAVIDRVKQTSPRAVFVVDLEASVPSGESEQLPLVSLNASRELWEQRFSCPVVFWLPAYAANMLAIHAKDFWRYRSHRFEFVAEPSEQSLAATPRSDTDLGLALNLSEDEKRFRVEELEQRIRDVGEKLEPSLVRLVAEWRSELGVLYASLGDLDRAERMYRMWLDAEEHLGRSEGMASSYHNLGIVYAGRGNLDEAERFYRMALDIDTQHDHQAEAAISYNSLGALYRRRGDLDEAERLHRRALGINKQLERHAGVANNYHNLGNVYFERGDLDQAQEMYHKALEINDRLGRRVGIADNCGGLGLLHQRRGDLDEAERMHQKALQIDAELGRREGMAVDYGNLGFVYRWRGDLDAAEQMQHRSLEISEELGRREGVADSCSNLGIICLMRGRFDEAQRMWEKALDLYNQIGATNNTELVQGWLESLPDVAN